MREVVVVNKKSKTPAKVLMILVRSHTSALIRLVTQDFLKFVINSFGLVSSMIFPIIRVTFETVPIFTFFLNIILQLLGFFACCCLLERYNNIKYWWQNQMKSPNSPIPLCMLTLSVLILYKYHVYETNQYWDK